MAQIQVRHLKSQILAMSVATMLALYAIGVATPALTPVPAYATNYENNDKHHDDKKNDKHHDDKKNDKHHDDKKNDKHHDYNDNHYSQFLMDVEQCFLDNGEQYSDDVEQCIYDVMAAYFDNDNNSEDSTSSSTTTTNGNSNNDLIEDTGDLDDNNSEDILSQM
jgi:ABC-type Zn2+ transport system substrate-binding protein/surface adhesin